MVRATISEVKNSLSAYLRRVRAGETVLIMDRKTPVASLIPASSDQTDDPRLARLLAAGVVAGVLDPNRFRPRPLQVGELAEGNLLEVIQDERRGGR